MKRAKPELHYYRFDPCDELELSRVTQTLRTMQTTGVILYCHVCRQYHFCNHRERIPIGCIRRVERLLKEVDLNGAETQRDASAASRD